MMRIQVQDQENTLVTLGISMHNHLDFLEQLGNMKYDQETQRRRRNAD